METLTGLSIGVVVALAGLLTALGTVAWVWRAIQAAGSEYRDRLTAQDAKIDAQEREIDDLRRQTFELREGRVVDAARLNDWILYARQLGKMLQEATGKEPPPEPEQHRPVGAAQLAALGRQIQEHFSRDEIDGLAFELGVNDAMSGDTNAARARELVQVAFRRGLLVRLIALYREQRPEEGA